MKAIVTNSIFVRAIADEDVVDTNDLYDLITPPPDVPEGYKVGGKTHTVDDGNRTVTTGYTYIPFSAKDLSDMGLA